jgi:hypothetical protein
MWHLEQWGSLVWGGASIPAMPITMLLGMVACFLAGGWFFQPSRRSRRSITVLVLLAALPLSIAAVSVPYTFVNGTIADAEQVNANFSALVGAANDLRNGLYQVGNPDPTAEPVEYAVDHERYVVEAGPAQVGTVVPMDIALMDSLCRDLDGCEVSVAMRHWAVSSPGNTIHRRFHLFYSEVDEWWRTETDVTGVQANSSTSQYVLEDCYFTDAETPTGVNGRSDLDRAFGLLNVAGGLHQDATTSCRVVVND